MIDLTDICNKTIVEMNGILPVILEGEHIDKRIEILEIYLIGLPKPKEKSSQPLNPVKLVRANVYFPEKRGYEERYYLQDQAQPRVYKLRNKDSATKLALQHVLIYSASGTDILKEPQSKDTSGRYATLDINTMQTIR